MVSAESPVGTMRIENRKLTDLLNFSGELGLTRTQLKATLDRTRDELDVLRESMKKIRDGLRDLEFEADAQMRAMPESQTAGITEDDFDRVRTAVRSLPVKYREVVVLKYLQELPTERIREILGVSDNVVYVRLNRARAMLKDKLSNLMDG